MSEPPSFPGFGESYRAWRKALDRWYLMTDYEEKRRPDRLLRVLSWQLQGEIMDALEPRVLVSDAGWQQVVRHLDQTAGLREDDELRVALREVLHANDRARDESLIDYVTRRHRQFEKAGRFEVRFPDRAKAFMMLEGAKLSHQSERNVRAMTKGVMQYEEVCRALRALGPGRQSTHTDDEDDVVGGER